MRKIQAILGLTAMLALSACGGKKQDPLVGNQPPIDINKAKSGDVVPGQYIVLLKAPSASLGTQSLSAQAARVSSQMTAMAAKYGAATVSKATAVNMMTIRATEQEIELLKKDPGVEKIFQDRIWKSDDASSVANTAIAEKVKSGLEASVLPNDARLDLNTINVKRDGARTASNVAILFSGTGVYAQQYNLGGKNFDVDQMPSCVEEWAYFGSTNLPGVTWWNDGNNATTQLAGLAASYYNPLSPASAPSASSSSGPNTVDGREVYSAAPGAKVGLVVTKMSELTFDSWQVCGVNRALEYKQRGTPTIYLMDQVQNKVGHDVDPRDKNGNSYKGTMTDDPILRALHIAKNKGLITVAPSGDIGGGDRPPNETPDDTNVAESIPGGYGYGMDGNLNAGAVITIGAFATGSKIEVLNKDGITHQRTFNTTYGHRIDLMAPGGTSCTERVRNAYVPLNNRLAGCLLPTTASPVGPISGGAEYDYAQGARAAAAIAAGVLARMVSTEFPLKWTAECGGNAWSQDALLCVMRLASREVTGQFGPSFSVIHNYGSPAWSGTPNPVFPPNGTPDPMAMNPNCDYTYPYDYLGSDDVGKNPKLCTYLYDPIFLPDGQ